MNTMWSPTHVQVTVQRTKNLNIKSKNAKNDVFVTIGLGKEKYQTSPKEKENQAEVIEWHEVCELQIPKQGNTAELILSILHRNFLGLDQFLGQVSIPLADIDVYERPKSKWYPLKGKNGQDNKNRGELQVKIAFTVKSGSLLDLSKKEKHRLSVGQLSSNINGSLLSLSSVDKKSFKKLAKTITSKIKREKKIQEISSSSINLSVENPNKQKSSQERFDCDPGVISDDDEFTLEELSHKGSACSLETNVQSEHKGLNSSSPITLNLHGSFESVGNSDILNKSPIMNRSPVSQDEWQKKLYRNKDNTLKLADTLKSKLKDTDQIPINHDRTKDKSPTPSLKNSPKVQKKNTISPLDDRSSNTKEINQENETSQKSKSTLSSWNKAYERIIIGKEKDSSHNQNTHSKHSSEILQKFEGKSRDDLIEMVIQLQSNLCEEIKQKVELEQYLDKLLLRVMETSPKILQTPYICYGRKTAI
ncbi:Rab-binding domain FIP-RBD,C2 domain [Cinara cedri]|uniref:Rab-binding domain FIP-RBD,C2 domain n=1 Tax=Cinara cedri TaxID=506608 RepID=A0A5E4N286_9HEMI|nr:Rab-binding domain FIP-RBD,C2 domain [Cinara cedri]